MFDANLKFIGRHAQEIRELAPSKLAGGQAQQDQTIFSRYVDILPVAVVLGFLCHRRSSVDDTTGAAASATNILLEQVNQVRGSLEFAYRLVLLLHDKEHLSLQTRMDRAFRYDSDAKKRAAGDVIFFDYMRGGIDLLYENLLAETASTEEDVKNLYVFIREIHDLYAKDVSIDDILALCNEAAV